MDSEGGSRLDPSTTSQTKGDDNPRLSAEWLLSAATGLSRVEVYAYHERPLTPEERSALREGVRSERQPASRCST